jgi:tRNA pseudouridine38-40 synthase
MRRPATPAQADHGVTGEAILLTLAYDGRPFSGWALQPGVRTVAGEVLGAVQALDPSVKELRGASRTDAGVHARAQLAAFDPALSIPPKGWALGLAAHLPDEIAVRCAAHVAVGTDPRRAAVRKRYRYSVLHDPLRDPFWHGRTLRWGGALDLERARTEGALLVGTHDFAAFRSSSDERTNTVRTIHDVSITADPADARIVRIDVVGSGFLHNMVRIIAGTILEVASGRLEALAVQRGLDSKRRDVLGMTAPAEGLCLEGIEHTIRTSDVWPPA